MTTAAELIRESICTGCTQVARYDDETHVALVERSYLWREYENITDYFGKHEGATWVVRLRK